MKFLKVSILLLLVVVASIQSRRRSREDEEEKELNESKNVSAKLKADIDKFAQLSDPKNQEYSLHVVDLMIQRLEKNKYPDCAKDMKQAKTNMKREYKLLAERQAAGKVGAQHEANKMKKIQEDYSIFYQQAVDCWLKGRAAKKAAKGKGKRRN